MTTRPSARPAAPRLLRCICSDQPLGELLPVMQAQALHTVVAIVRATGCGAHCGACRPYIARMLETGVAPTNHDIMTPAELDHYRRLTEASAPATP